MAKKAAKEHYNNFPKTILDSVKKFESAFLHKYPNLDVVMQGGDLLDRPKLVRVEGKGVLVMTVAATCKVKAGDHVFLGAIRAPGVALAYIDSREGNTIRIGSMSSEIAT